MYIAGPISIARVLQLSGTSPSVRKWLVPVLPAGACGCQTALTCLSKQERSLGEVSGERECSALWIWHCGGPHIPNLPFAHYFRCECSLECGPACHKALLKPQATVPKLLRPQPSLCYCREAAQH